MLKKLKIKNYRGFTLNTSFDFGKINVFVGPNSAGKSSILKLINQFDEGEFYTPENFEKNISFNKKTKKMEITYTIEYIKQEIDNKNNDELDFITHKFPFAESMKFKILDNDLILDELKIKAKNFKVRIKDYNTDPLAITMAKNLNTSFNNIFSIFENFDKIKKYINDHIFWGILYDFVHCTTYKELKKLSEEENIYKNILKLIDKNDLPVESTLENQIKKELILMVYDPDLIKTIFNGISKGAFTKIYPHELVQFWKLKKIDTLMQFQFHPKIFLDDIANWYKYIVESNIAGNLNKKGYYHLAQMPDFLFKYAFKNNKKHFSLESTIDEKNFKIYYEDFNFFGYSSFADEGMKGYLKLLEFDAPYNNPGPYDYEMNDYHIDFDPVKNQYTYYKGESSSNVIENVELSFLIDIYLNDLSRFFDNLLSDSFVSLVKTEIEKGKALSEIIDFRFLHNIILVKSIYFLLAYVKKSIELLNRELEKMKNFIVYDKIYLPAVRNEFLREFSVFKKSHLEKMFHQIVLTESDRLNTLQKNINKWFSFFEIPYKFKFEQFKDNLNNNFIQPILLDIYTEFKLSLDNVGFGFSQIIPVILRCQSSFHKIINIEQPESQLHPKLQSRLADLFVENAETNQFFIETHSEYLIRRLQVLIKEGKIKAEDVKIYYINKDEKGRSSAMQMRLDENGRFLDEWPSGFFDESYNQSIALL